MEHKPDSPTDFRVATVGPELADVFAAPRPEAPGGAKQKISQLPNYLADANTWWSNWVPVAATGWGALVVIVPLIAGHFLMWVAGGRRGD